MDSRQLLEAIYAAGDRGSWDDLLQVYAPVFRNNGEEMTAVGWRDAVASFYSAFDDIHHDLFEVSVDGDLLWNRSVMHATHVRDLTIGSVVYPASGNRADLAGLELRRISNGRVVELWSAFDFVSFTAQLQVFQSHQ